MKQHLPYFAVIFTNVRSSVEGGYQQMAEEMMALAAEQPGYLGVDHAREAVGITISYWESLEAIAAWKAQADHLEAQQKGKAYWYDHYTVRICRVEREYSFKREASTDPA